MPPITTGAFAKLLWPGINAIYGQSYNEFVVEYTEIFDFNKSVKHHEEDVGVTSFGLAPVKPEGAPIAYDSMEQGFLKRYVHVTYALGFIITREIYEDDLYDTVSAKRAKALAFSMRQTKEIVHANILNRSFNPLYPGADGLPLFDLLHVNVTGGTWRNELFTPSDLNESSLEQACIDIADFKNDRGLRIAILPRKLIIPPELEFDAARILKSLLQPGTANNDINVIKANGKIPEGAKVNHYLTDPDAWFLKTDCPDGLKTFERRADNFGTENDFDTENAKYKASGRYSAGWTDPRCAFGSPGA